MKKKQVNLMLIIFSILGIAIIVGILTNSLPGNDTAPTETEDTSVTVPVETNTLIDDDEILGNKNAKVIMVEFSDYECPYCVRFHDTTYQNIKKDYIDTGLVAFVHRDFPLPFHSQAQKSAEAAECAGEQGKYFEMHEKLYASGVAGGVASFKKYAKEIEGLDFDSFQLCLDTSAMKDEIAKDLQDGESLGITGTPAFFINNRLIVGAQPYSLVKPVIEAELNK